MASELREIYERLQRLEGVRPVGKRDQVADLVDRVNELGARMSAAERALDDHATLKRAVHARLARLEAALDRLWLGHLADEHDATGCPICDMHGLLEDGEDRVAKRLRGLGAAHKPPDGWEDRVRETVSRGATRDTDGPAPAPPAAPSDDDHVDDSTGTSWSEPD